MTLSKALRDPVHKMTTIPIMALNEGTGLSFHRQYLYHYSPVISTIIGSALGWKVLNQCQCAQQMIYNKIFVHNFRNRPLSYILAVHYCGL